MSDRPVCFISYCREDEAWRSRVAEQFWRQGIEVWDDTRIRWGEAWRQKIAEAIAEASGAVLLLSEDFLKSDFVKTSELPRLRERWQCDGLPIFPIEICPCSWTAISWLGGLQVARIPPGDGFQTGAVLAAIIRDIAEILLRRSSAELGRPEPPIRPRKVFLSRLPHTSANLFGREEELAKLDRAWGSARANVVSVVGFGGAGKTALVNRWLGSMSEQNFAGANRVYAWSFGQGYAENEQVSAEAFLAHALEWFDDPDPDKGTTWDKGARLAELVRRERTLLILDGVEPLLHPPGERSGYLRDPGLQGLLGELVWYNPGLCVITTRVAVEDLRDARSSLSIDLGNLKPKDGAAYLTSLGVKGTEVELQEVSRELGGHALALTLLGKYLVAACHGDVRQRNRISSEPGAEVERIMEVYEAWLGGKPELGVLRVMGLFDRPIESRAIEALRAEPAIVGLTSELPGLSREEWQLAVNGLRGLRLVDPEDAARPDTLDCHALVRRYFGEKLKRTSPDSWREAHCRLYEYYMSVVTKELPDTFEEMAPLFTAITHGCAAGRYHEVLHEVYLRRTRRYGEFYSTQKLGAFGADLAALACFFEVPWTEPVEDLAESDRATVLNEAGEALRALGRLTEAVPPLKAAARLNVALGELGTAAINTGNLSQLFLAIGDLMQALDSARESVELAERSGNAFQRMVRRCDLANTLHHLGWARQAGAAFEFAEQIQKAVAEMLETQRPVLLPVSVRYEWSGPFLHGVRGYQYCDLLLTEGRFQEVLERAVHTIEISKRTGRLLHIGLDHLTHGRACLMRNEAHSAEDFAEVTYHLEQAVSYLRQCGRQDYLPRGLVARAELHRMRRIFKDAQRDIDEAISIATRDGMALHQADCHLEHARLCLAMSDKEKARRSLDAARQITEKTSYHRRDRDVREIAENL